jgi:hypothetical protein
MYIYTCKYMYIYIYAYTYIYMYVCMYICLHILNDYYDDVYLNRFGLSGSICITYTHKYINMCAYTYRYLYDIIVHMYLFCCIQFTYLNLNRRLQGLLKEVTSLSCRLLKMDNFCRYL